MKDNRTGDLNEGEGGASKGREGMPSQITPHRKPPMLKTCSGQQYSFEELMRKARIKDKHTGDFSEGQKKQQ